MNNCGSCRHWLLTIYDRRPSKPDTTWGQCALVGLYGPTTNALARILNTDRRPAALQTHRDYGCVQWEAE